MLWATPYLPLERDVHPTEPQDPTVFGPEWTPPADDRAQLALHPNLARIAVEYQRICERFAHGALDEAAANREIQHLIARDDEGVAWTINPTDGGWLYWSRKNTWIPADPPQSGLASLTPYDLYADGSIDPSNPDAAIRFTVAPVVDDELRGSTRRDAQRTPWQRPRWLYPAAIVVALVIAAVIILLGVDRSKDRDPAVKPVPVTETTIAAP